MREGCWAEQLDNLYWAWRPVPFRFKHHCDPTPLPAPPHCCDYHTLPAGSQGWASCRGVPWTYRGRGRLRQPLRLLVGCAVDRGLVHFDTAFTLPPAAEQDPIPYPTQHSAPTHYPWPTPAPLLPTLPPLGHTMAHTGTPHPTLGGVAGQAGLTRQAFTPPQVPHLVTGFLVRATFPQFAPHTLPRTPGTLLAFPCWVLRPVYAQACPATPPPQNPWAFCPSPFHGTSWTRTPSPVAHFLPPAGLSSLTQDLLPTHRPRPTLPQRGRTGGYRPTYRDYPAPRSFGLQDTPWDHTSHRGCHRPHRLLPRTCISPFLPGSYHLHGLFLQAWHYRPPSPPHCTLDFGTSHTHCLCLGLPPHSHLP